MHFICVDTERGWVAAFRVQSLCGILQSKGLRAGSELEQEVSCSWTSRISFCRLVVWVLGKKIPFHVDKPAQNGKYSSLETRSL